MKNKEDKVKKENEKSIHKKFHGYIFAYRERKLQETLLAVQQLDVSMSNLRKWLADMENDLAAPIVYVECTRKEIQKKLQHQNVRLTVKTLYIGTPKNNYFFSCPNTYNPLK